MTKRLLTLLVSLLLCVSVVAVGAASVSAQTAATVTVATVTGKVGDVVEVPVSISADSYLVNADMLITYDTEKLALDTTFYADPDDDEATLGYQVNTAMFPVSWMYGGNETVPGMFKFLVAGSGQTGLTAGGEMFRLAFRILADDGEPIEIAFSADPFRGNDGSGETNDAGYPMDTAIALTVENGSVIVEDDFLRGDVNGDGEIDMRDAFAVYRAASGGDVTDELLLKGDMNEDGEIDMRDAFAVYKIASGS